MNTQALLTELRDETLTILNTEDYEDDEYLTGWLNGLEFAIDRIERQLKKGTNERAQPN